MVLLWKLQNRIRAMIDIGFIYEKSQKKAIEQRAKQAKSLEQFDKVQKKFKEESQKLLDLEKQYSGKQLDEKLIKESLSYRLARERGLTQEQALFYQKEELAIMGEQIEKQEKKIKGGIVLQNIRKGLAALDIGTKKVFGITATKKKEMQETGKGPGNVLAGILKATSKKAGLSDKLSKGAELGAGHAKDLANAIGKKFPKVKAFSLFMKAAATTDKKESKWRKYWRKQGGNIAFFFQKMKFVMVYVMMALLVVVLLGALIASIWSDIQVAIDGGSNMFSTLFTIIHMLFTTGVAIVMEVVAFVTDLLSGNFEGVLEHAGNLLDLIMTFAWQGLLTGIVLVGTLFWSVWEGAKKFASKFIKDEDFRSSVYSLLWKVAKLWLYWYLATSILAYAGTVAAGIIAAVPLVLILLGVMLFALAAWIVDQVNPFAAGGTSHGGVAIVGEKGPELVKLPAGSKVTDASKTAQLAKGSTTNNVSVNVQGRMGASDQELRELARKLGPLILQEMNRSTSTNMF